MPNFARRIPKNLHRLVNSPRNFPPNSYTIFKRLFAFTMRLPPNNLYKFASFSTGLSPKYFYNFCQLHDLGTFVCESRRLSPQFPRLSQNTCVISRTFFENSLFEALVPPTGFHLKFPRLTQNTCVIASPARFLKKSSKHLVLCTPLCPTFQFS